MITYKTLEVYLERVEIALAAIEEGIVRHERGLKDLKEQRIAVAAQVETLQNLMDVEENPPIVELPMAGPESIEEHFDKRLETHDGSTADEVYQKRQDKVYHSEAMETVEVLDEANRTKSTAE